MVGGYDLLNRTECWRPTVPGFTESMGTNTLVSGCTITAAAAAGSDGFGTDIRVLSMLEAFSWLSDGRDGAAAGTLKNEL